MFLIKIIHYFGHSYLGYRDGHPVACAKRVSARFESYYEAEIASAILPFLSLRWLDVEIVEEQGKSLADG